MSRSHSLPTTVHCGPGVSTTTPTSQPSSSTSPGSTSSASRRDRSIPLVGSCCRSNVPMGRPWRASRSRRRAPTGLSLRRCARPPTERRASSPLSTGRCRRPTPSTAGDSSVTTGPDSAATIVVDGAETLGGDRPGRGRRAVPARRDRLDGRRDRPVEGDDRLGCGSHRGTRDRSPTSASG